MGIEDLQVGKFRKGRGTSAIKAAKRSQLPKCWLLSQDLLPAVLAFITPIA